MADELISGIIAGGTGIITGIAGYIFGNRQRTAQARGSELDNVEKAVAIWQGLAEDLRQEVAGMKSEIIKLRDENNRLESEISVLRLQIQAHVEAGCDIL